MSVCSAPPNAPIFQVAALYLLLKCPFQQANNSSTNLGITELIPHKQKIRDHNSLALIIKWNPKELIDLVIHKEISDVQREPNI